MFFLVINGVCGHKYKMYVTKISITIIIISSKIYLPKTISHIVEMQRLHVGVPLQVSGLSYLVRLVFVLKLVIVNFVAIIIVSV